MESGYTGNLDKQIRALHYSSTGFLLEKGSYFQHLTILENLFLYKNQFDISDQNMVEKLRQWGLYELRHSKAANLSLGQLSRMSIMMALFTKPGLLVLDEPESSLDYLGNQELQKCLQEWRLSHPIVVIASHLPRNIHSLDYLIVLDQGSIIFKGETPSLREIATPFSNNYLVYLRDYLLRR